MNNEPHAERISEAPSTGTNPSHSALMGSGWRPDKHHLEDFLCKLKSLILTPQKLLMKGN